MLHILRNHLGNLLALALLIGFTSPLAFALTTDQVLSPAAVTVDKQGPVIDEAARTFLAERDSETGKIWVFFTDKGVTGRSGFEAKAAGVAIETRSLVRRAKVGKDEVLFADLPVNRDYVDQIVGLGAEFRRVSRWLNAATFEVELDLLDEIARLNFVAKVQPMAFYKREVVSYTDKLMDFPPMAASPDALNYGSSFVQLDQLGVPELHSRGFNGEGVTLAILDTGFRKSHEAFAQHYLDGRVLGEYDFVFGDGNTANEPEDNSSQWNHGTLIWSVSGGLKDGNIYGPAYKANFLLAKTEDVRSETPVEEDNWVAALEWADSAGADVLTSSLSYSDWYVPAAYDGMTAVTTLAANTAAGLGIVVCNSAGNSGPSSPSLSAPVDAFDIVAVGAVNSAGTIASFSSRGPTVDARIKPEVCAMGVSTYSASSSGDANYTTANGTSLSTPLVAGVVACLIQAHPTFTPQLIRQSLLETSSQSGSPNNTYGWGIVDGEKAVEWGVRMATDVQVGEAPLTVQFSDSSDLAASTWKWSFGDGDSALVETPSHVYQTVGAFDVALTIGTVYGDITDLNTSYILATGDTLWLGPDSGFAGQDIVVSVNLKNTQPLGTFYLPIRYTNSAAVQWTSAEPGDRINYFESFQMVAFDPFNNKFTLKATADMGGGALPLPPGEGEVVKLVFSSDALAVGGESASVDSTEQSSYSVELITDFASYGPAVHAGQATVTTVQRGDVNYTQSIDIADLTFMVAYMFKGGAAPLSFVSGDINDDLSHDISDVTYLVSFQFKGGPPPPPL